MFNPLKLLILQTEIQAETKEVVSVVVGDKGATKLEEQELVI